MFPIRDSLSLRRTPVMTWILIAGTCAAFLYELMLGEGQLEELVYQCGIVPARWLDPRWARHAGLPPRDFWPFLTSMFLHGNWLHLLGNVWALWIFGDNVEDRLGSLRFLVFYVLCGLGAGLLHFVSNPYSRVPTIGASGAIAGVMGAFFVLYPRSRVLTLLPVGCFPLFVPLP